MLSAAKEFWEATTASAAKTNADKAFIASLLLVDQAAGLVSSLA
jgi:hypothetical protein